MADRFSKLSDDEKTTIGSYDADAEEWSDEHLNPEYWEKEYAMFNKHLKSGRVLEVGCGGGRDARELIKMGYDYEGFDISEGLLEQAKKNNPGAKFKLASLYDIDYDEEFDGLWCAAVLLHIPREKIDLALAPMNKALKPGGVGMIIIKKGEGQEMEEHRIDSRLFVLWSDEDFRAALSRNGFEVIDTNYRPRSERTRWLEYVVKKT